MEILDVVFEIEDYLVQNGWKKRNNIYRKGMKSLYLTNNKLMIALNNNSSVKHKHIVTCEVPKDFFEAQVIFKNCRLNFNTENNDTDNKH